MDKYIYGKALTNIHPTSLFIAFFIVSDETGGASICSYQSVQEMVRFGR